MFKFGVISFHNNYADQTSGLGWYVTDDVTATFEMTKVMMFYICWKWYDIKGG